MVLISPGAPPKSRACWDHGSSPARTSIWATRSMCLRAPGARGAGARQESSRPTIRTYAFAGQRRGAWAWLGRRRSGRGARRAHGRGAGRAVRHEVGRAKCGFRREEGRGLGKRRFRRARDRPMKTSNAITATPTVSAETPEGRARARPPVKAAPLERRRFESASAMHCQQARPSRAARSSRALRSFLGLAVSSRGGDDACARAARRTDAGAGSPRRATCATSPTWAGAASWCPRADRPRVLHEPHRHGRFVRSRAREAGGWNFRPAGDKQEVHPRRVPPLPSLGVWMGAGSVPKSPRKSPPRIPTCCCAIGRPTRWAAAWPTTSATRRPARGASAVDYDVRSAPEMFRYGRASSAARSG